MPRRNSKPGMGGRISQIDGGVRERRCAIYTRKSVANGLDQEVNSLMVQREACSSYIASQKSEGYVELSDLYDDGGFSGGNMERPALKRLMTDITADRVDVVLVYKIDRLTRSLRDFARIVEVFEAKSVTFVSVTQAFNTTTGMGRLTLNVLLSFAQFEREMIGDRLKDKFASLRAKGFWVGPRPYGYTLDRKRLLVHEVEAKTIRQMFHRFVELGSAQEVATELTAAGHVTQWGTRINSHFVIRHLRNRLYIGDLVHRGIASPGTHPPLVSCAEWDRTQDALAKRALRRTALRRPRLPAMLSGMIFGPTGHAMIQDFTTSSSGKIYRYYVSTLRARYGTGACPITRVKAEHLEDAVFDIVTKLTTVQSADDLGYVSLKPRTPPTRKPAPARDKAFEAGRHLIVKQIVKRVDLDTEGLIVTLHSGARIACRLRPMPEIG